MKWFEPDLNPAYEPAAAAAAAAASSASRDKPQLTHGDHALHLDSAVTTTNWADTIRFADLPFSAQRVALFLRAVVKKPDLVVLDEAFSGMDAALRDRCLLFLTWGTTKFYGEANRRGRRPKTSTGRARVLDTPKEVLDLEGMRVDGLSSEQALIVVSHVPEEVPGLVRDWMCLPEAATGEKVRFGRLKGPLEGMEGEWERIWFGEGGGRVRRKGRGKDECEGRGGGRRSE